MESPFEIPPVPRPDLAGLSTMCWYMDREQPKANRNGGGLSVLNWASGCPQQVCRGIWATTSSQQRTRSERAAWHGWKDKAHGNEADGQPYPSNTPTSMSSKRPGHAGYELEVGQRERHAPLVRLPPPPPSSTSTHIHQHTDKRTTNARLQNTQASNEALFASVPAQRAEIEALIAQLEGHVDGANGMLADVAPLRIQIRDLLAQVRNETISERDKERLLLGAQTLWHREQRRRQQQREQDGDYTQYQQASPSRRPPPALIAFCPQLTTRQLDFIKNTYRAYDNQPTGPPVPRNSIPPQTPPRILDLNLDPLVARLARDNDGQTSTSFTTPSRPRPPSATSTQRPRRRSEGTNPVDEHGYGPGRQKRRPSERANDGIFRSNEDFLRHHSAYEAGIRMASETASPRILRTAQQRWTWTITRKACATHFAFLNANPGTLTPAPLYEYPGFRAAGDGNANISLAAFRAARTASTASTVRVHNNVFMPALRGDRDDEGDRAERVTAGLTAISWWNKPTTSQLRPQDEEQTQDERQTQDAGNPSQPRPPPIPNKKPAWHEAQVRNARHFQHFFYEEARRDTRKFAPPSDLAAAANIQPYYSDLQDNEERRLASWKKDPAPLKRIFAHQSWKDALKRSGMDPTSRKDPGNRIDGGNEGIDNGPGNGIKNGPGMGSDDGPGIGFDHGPGNATNNGRPFSEEGLVNNLAAQVRVDDSADAQNRNRFDNYLRPRGPPHEAALDSFRRPVSSGQASPYMTAGSLCEWLAGRLLSSSKTKKMTEAIGTGQGQKPGPGRAESALRTVVEHAVPRAAAAIEEESMQAVPGRDGGGRRQPGWRGIGAVCIPGSDHHDRSTDQTILSNTVGMLLRRSPFLALLFHDPAPAALTPNRTHT
ncbi:hypothetical protein CkaCkLH20_12621 [Colletotrichum karsti]|uniref:Uncharacterized protein n=1 Tax=Colletotrichum karsti TaxID=1095194 RepID=A0A9P6HTI2_9PEZI|nr:uncharacterized protein CkaCkLH20_12621 [Colletotrichum karsti]KAF9869914.1 hypothetical protein CkaCkLH20_12621 [Colletotrichum karsti]